MRGDEYIGLWMTSERKVRRPRMRSVTDRPCLVMWQGQFQLISDC